ncbi:hypothetical protein G5B39_04040 [Rhodobacteraceae bacterium SC52]|nr:hypothetical protein G5B39_04040 [Rhodobacteraceae bacterium SC52]
MNTEKANLRVMRSVACVLAVLFAASCDSPSPPMFGAQSTRLTVGGHSFTVHHTSQRAESVRTSVMAEPGLRQMLLLSRTAIETASGCVVRPGTMYGDRVMAEAFLNCDGEPPAILRPQWRFALPN